MSRLDDLPPDQRAVLSLLLRQGKRYGEVAALLSIQERAVRDRAQAALAVLAPREARELSAEERLRIGDYLLGQQGADEHERSIQLLRDCSAARVWAQALAGELATLTSASLPEIPGGPGQSSLASRAPGSRTGGAILLGATAVVAIVVVVLIVSGGFGGGSNKAAKATSTSTSAASTKTATNGSVTPHEDFHTTLTPPDPSSKAAGAAFVLSEGSKRAFYVQASGLTTASSGTYYAVWLTSPSAKAEALGLLPAENTAHRVEGGGPLPKDAGRYNRLIVTHETSQHPLHPGQTVLGGSFSLG